MEDYYQEVKGSTTIDQNQDLKVGNAELVGKTSGKLIMAKLECTEDCTINFISSSTHEIKHLICKKLTIFAEDSATVVLTKITADYISVVVNNSSTLNIKGGTVTELSGRINHASTGTCKAKFEIDNVESMNASTWRT